MLLAMRSSGKLITGAYGNENLVNGAMCMGVWSILRLVAVLLFTYFVSRASFPHIMVADVSLQRFQRE
jgi:hypothetical protein